MSSKGNYNGNLSEKDELIKSLREKQKGTNNPSLKASIKKKADALAGNNTLEK